MIIRPSALVVFFALISGVANAQNGPSTDSMFALHVGPAYTRLPDTDFKIVTALSGQDLFSQVKGEEASGDFAVFASQALWNGSARAARAYATVGTSLTRHGPVLYFGGSAGVSRALVTIGLATALVERGVNPVSDQVFPASGARELFGSIEQIREWGFFVGVSVALIR